MSGPLLTEDPALLAQAERARTFVYQLIRGLKQMGMYRHQEAKFGSFLQRTFEALHDFTREFGPLPLRVELETFSLHGQSVLNEDSPLPYRFFKDGIRSLIFHPSMTLPELVTVATIALSDPDRGAEDLHAQLWQAQLPGFELVLVEGFKLDELAADEVEVEIDAIVEHLEGRLRTAEVDYLRFARISKDDVEVRINDVEQMRGLVVMAGSGADAELRAKVQREIAEEEHQRLFPKLISAVFQVIETGVDDAALLEETFIHLLDGMLLQDDFTTINQMMMKMRALTKNGANEAASTLYRSLRAKIADEQRLHRVGEALRVSRPKKPVEVARYLTGLPAQVVPTLLDVLDSVEVPENRALLVEVLATYLEHGAEPFLVRLQSDRPALVRDVAGILERAKHPERINWFAEVLKSPNPAIKRELVTLIGANPTPQARPLVVACLDDDTQLVRMQAAKLLPEFGGDRAYIDLMRVIRSSAFAARAPLEREAFYTGLATTDVPGAFTFLVDLLKAKPGLFQKQKVNEEKMLVVKALSDAATLHTFKALTEVANDGAQSGEVLGAARQAVFRLKKLLAGEGAPAPSAPSPLVGPRGLDPAEFVAPSVATALPSTPPGGSAQDDGNGHAAVMPPTPKPPDVPVTRPEPARPPTPPRPAAPPLQHAVATHAANARVRAIEELIETTAAELEQPPSEAKSRPIPPTATEEAGAHKPTTLATPYEGTPALTPGNRYGAGITISISGDALPPKERDPNEPRPSSPPPPVKRHG